MSSSTRLEVVALQRSVGGVRLAVERDRRGSPSSSTVDLDQRHHDGHPQRRAVVAPVRRGSVEHAHSPSTSTWR